MENRTTKNMDIQQITSFLESKTSEVDRRLKEIEKQQRQTVKQNKWPLMIAAISVLVSLVSISIAYNYPAKQVNFQAKQADFQEDQALVQMTMSLNNSWNETFKIENRLRFERFRAKLNEWSSNPQTRDHTLALLIDNKEISIAKNLRENNYIMDLLLPELKAKDIVEARSRTDYDIIVSAFQYRNTVINCLNTMESIYTIKSYSKSQKTVDIIDAHHTRTSRFG